MMTWKEGLVVEDGLDAKVLMDKDRKNYLPLSVLGAPWRTTGIYCWRLSLATLLPGARPASKPGELSQCYTQRHRCANIKAHPLPEF